VGGRGLGPSVTVAVGAWAIWLLLTLIATVQTPIGLMDPVASVITAVAV
jgi:hypothetical protein